jgi:hypothetical protein
MMAPALWDTSSVRISFPCNNASAARHDFAKLAADIAAGPLDLQKEVQRVRSVEESLNWRSAVLDFTLVPCQWQEHKCLPHVGNVGEGDEDSD